MDRDDRKVFLWTFFIMVLVTLISAFVIAVKIQGDPLLKLKLAVSYGLLVLIFLFGFLILAAIATGLIDISQLLEDDSGGASTSRFQLLIFTFVIGLSFVLIVACDCKFPDVPPNVLALLGVSASTYAVSKGIQAGSGNGSDTSSTTASTSNTTTSGTVIK